MLRTPARLVDMEWAHDVDSGLRTLFADGRAVGMVIEVRQIIQRGRSPVVTQAGELLKDSRGQKPGRYAAVGFSPSDGAPILLRDQHDDLGMAQSAVEDYGARLRRAKAP